MEPIIELNDVTRRFGEKEVLKMISAKIFPGDFVVITGASGSGKSTLLNILGLLDVPTTGDYTLFGKRNVKPFSNKAIQLLRNDIGYLFQNYALLENETVEQNLKIALEYKKDSNKNHLIEKALENVGLSGYQKRMVYSCSGGEQQRIALARLLLKPCRLVIADEPTGSLDDKNSEEVLDLLSKMNQAGKTIILVTHDLRIVKYATKHIKM